MTFGLGDVSTCVNPNASWWWPFPDAIETACRINVAACGNTTCGSASARQEQIDAGMLDPATGNPVGVTKTTGDLTTYLPWIAIGIIGILVLKGR